jgi:hypothetical protein
VKNRTKTVEAIIHQYMRSIYPDRGGVLPIHEILINFDEQQSFLSALMNDIYNNAQDIKKASKRKIADIDQEFKVWLDQFTAPISMIKI